MSDNDFHRMFLNSLANCHPDLLTWLLPGFFTAHAQKFGKSLGIERHFQRFRQIDPTSLGAPHLLEEWDALYVVERGVDELGVEHSDDLMAWLAAAREDALASYDSATWLMWRPQVKRAR